MKPCRCQDLKPGLTGMGPSKWVTFKHSYAPGKYYRSVDGPKKKYTQEDLYVRAWIPILHKPNYAIVVGPHYRTEQLEFKNSGENPINQMDNWQLRSMGIDLKSFFKLNSTSYLVVASNVTKSGNLTEVPFRHVPLNYNFTSVFMKKRSERSEIGIGVLVSRAQNLSVLPVLVLNYNFPSEKSGLEIALPKKISWRYNLSPTDIFYIKSEAVTKSYYTYKADRQPSLFRLIDLDTGVTYNKQINKLIGVEVFGGYRMNVSNRLPSGIVPVRTSGLAASFEIYLLPPFSSRKK
ncbi:DUF6268 family outer membrane beta-barrel protein [Dyadobacter psychrotolerans]|uniref:DUF6268 domain-containing protein n=1 Tax=Dyadobacter psychrotolerans TaxID=2541721 RepID=A0A4R5DK40_9BACT|nr:DUF6268 family outer membrane beta-barrel protein [Dyadobacter psychrotolerans]TDE14512.1 hypothetical protein E0F88_15040 [Dyadobacter psychrotolerans]